MSDAPRPTDVVPFPNGELGVVWDDGHRSYYPGHLLRCACACARCIDETTGVKVLVDEQVPDDVKPLEAHPVGRYGMSLVFSDGHDTGIYEFAKLRALCPCEACAG